MLAAGGVFTGQQVAAALALGADGVVLGSALLASPESLFSSLQKDAIVKAKGRQEGRGDKEIRGEEKTRDKRKY